MPRETSHVVDNKANKIIVTGASGFIGRHLVSALIDGGASVDVLVRPSRVPDVTDFWPGRAVAARAGDLLDHSSLVGICDDVRTVFHLAGYAHAEDAQADDTHWRVTVEGTRALLREVVRAGVSRFVFVSTVKVMGDGGQHCLDERSPLAPRGAYGRAKRVAEEMVFEAGSAHDLPVCVIRLPLVYGRDNKGNLPRMIVAIDRGRFPPLPAIPNRRSMVHVDDVVQALLLAAEQPQARGQRYIVTDGLAYSTSDIYMQIRHALGKGSPAWCLPRWVLRVGARVGDLIGRIRRRPLSFNSMVFGKLTESAWYSNDKIRRELGFRPTRTFTDGLPEMIQEYRLRER